MPPSLAPGPRVLPQPLAKVTGGSARDQARAAALLAAPLLLAACDLPGRADLRAAARELAGFGLEARLPPPGLDRPSPSLAEVPPRPEPPSREAREAVTRGLEAARAAAGTPQPPGPAGAPRFAPAPGAPPLPGAPPPPPRLAAAPAIPWTAAAEPAPVAPPPAGEAAPAAPDPEPLAPPPPPPPALLAPR